MTAEQDWSRIERTRGIEAFETLKNKKVSVIGLGSFGCEVVRGLAMNGIGGIVLTDNGYLEEGNVVRHPGRFNQIGWRKTEVAKDIILSKNPRAKITISNEDATNIPALYKNNYDADLVVVAGLGSVQSQDSVAQVLRKLKKPVVFGAVYNAAEALELIFVNGDVGPCYRCFMTIGGFKDPRPDQNPYNLPTDQPADQVGTMPGLPNRINIAANMAIDPICDILLGKTFTFHNDPAVNLFIFAMAKTWVPYSTVPEDRKILKPYQTMWMKIQQIPTCDSCFPKEEKRFFRRRKLSDLIRGRR